MGWFWINMPLALLFFAAWVGIPLWLVLTRWHRETEAKHAQIAARAAIQPIVVPSQPTPVDPAVARVYAGVAGSSIG